MSDEPDVATIIAMLRRTLADLNERCERLERIESDEPRALRDQSPRTVCRRSRSD